MKIRFTGTGCVPASDEARNLSHTATLGLPFVEDRPRPPLAVVGGGPSILSRADELRQWPGDVWACGTAFRWCVDNGIRATFFCVDPQAETSALCAGATHAIVCTSIHPATLDALRGAAVEVFDLIHTADTCNHGPTSASSTMELSIRMGYRDVTYFGCESSFEERSHAYHDERNEHIFRVKCNGQSFLTNPPYFMQAEYLSAMIRLTPLLKERSGGLLAAMVADPDYDITHGNRAFHEHLGTIARSVA